MPREDCEGAGAAAKIFVIQGRRRTVDHRGRQAQAACRVRGDGKRTLRYLEESEDLKVGVTELQERLEMTEEEGVSSIRQTAQQAKNEGGQKIFEIFRQGEGVRNASLARWNAQLKGLTELEKRCQHILQEVKLLSERQEVLKGMVEDKIRLQSRVTEKYYEQIFEEVKEPEEKKSKEALLFVQKRHILTIY